MIARVNNPVVPLIVWVSLVSACAEAETQPAQFSSTAQSLSTSEEPAADESFAIPEQPLSPADDDEAHAISIEQLMQLVTEDGSLSRPDVEAALEAVTHSAIDEVTDTARSQPQGEAHAEQSCSTGQYRDPSEQAEDELAARSQADLAGRSRAAGVQAMRSPPESGFAEAR